MNRNTHPAQWIDQRELVLDATIALLRIGAILVLGLLAIVAEKWMLR